MRRSPSPARPCSPAVIAALLLAALLLPAPASAATLTPTEPPTLSGVFREGGVVNATPGTWPGAEPTIRYQWQRCNARGQFCTTITGRTQQAYTAVSADVGGTLRVEVNVLSADGAGQAVSAPSQVITGIAPANTTAPVVAGYPRSGQTLTADPRAWAGTQPIDFAYQWVGCDSRGQACSPLPGATAHTYALTDADLGRRFQVRVTAINAAGTSVIHSGQTAVVGPPAPPVALRPPAVTGTARDTQQLSADRGGWGGAEPMTYAYRWLRCNALAPDACSPVAGQTGPTFRLTPADLGQLLRTEVTATNPDGAATQLSAPTEPVAPQPPTPAGAPTITGTPRAGQLLTGTRNLFNGTPEIEYAVQWRRCVEDVCTDIPGATAATYRLTAADAGGTIVFAVTATNAAGSATKPSLPTRLVAPAAPPRNTSPPTVSGTARDGLALTSTNGTWTGLSSRFAQQWLRCDAAGAACTPITGATRTIYTLTPADVGSSVRLRVTATNEDGTTEARSAPTAAVLAIPPAPVAPALAGAAAEGATLTVTPGTWGGSPPIRLAYGWERCAADATGCRTIDGADEVTYRLAPADIGSRVRARVTGENAGGSVSAVSALTARVEGTAPLSDEPGPAIRGVPRDGEPLSGDRGTWRGTAPMAYSLQWQRCNVAGGACAPIAGATGAAYTPGAADHGATVRLHVEATNAYGTRSADSPATAVIAAAPPEMVARPIVSGPREDGATLTATPGRWTGTAPLAYAYQWEREDPLSEAWNPIPGATAAAYRLTSADVGATLRAQVTVTNPAASPGVATSAAVTGIAPVAPVAVAAPAVSGTARDGQVLTADPGRWTGTEPRREYLQWLRCDAEGAACASIAGATEATYRLAAADIGRTLRIRVSIANAATSATGPVRARSERTSVVVPDPPASRVAPTVIGVPRDGRTLTAEPGEWTGSARIEFAYRWERCTTAAPVRCEPLDGASGSAYQLRSSEIGSTVRVQVTAANPGGSATAASAPTTAVAGDPPHNVERPSVAGTAFDGDLLTASPGRWTGAVPFTYDYRWARCNSAVASCGTIPGATAATYRVGPADLGYRIRLEVIARNAGGSTSAVAVATPTASARPPAVVTAPTLAGRPGVGQELTGTDGTWSGTAPVTLSREWLRCDALGTACEPIPGATALRYRLTAADLGHRVRLRIRADNPARGTGTLARTAPTRVIRDDPPKVLTAPKITASGGGVAAETVPLTASQGTWEGGPPMLPVYRWQRCDIAGGGCVDIAGATHSRYVPVALDRGARLRVTVTIDNGVGAATGRSEATAAVRGAPPVNAVPPSVIVRTELRSGGELTAAPGQWTGAAPIATSFQWLRCDAAGDDCAAISGAISSTYSLRDADIGHALRVRVRAANETAAASETSGAAGVVAALPPAIVGSVRLSADASRLEPGVHVVGDTASWTGTAPVAVERRWQRCTSPSACEDIRGATGESYELAESDVGHRVRLAVTARNAGGTASAASAVSDLVTGSPPAASREPAVTVEPGSSLTDGGVLRADRGEWSGTGPLAYAMQWQRCSPDDGLDGPRCTPIAGATSPSYTLIAADVGQRLAIMVSARGPGGRTDELSPLTGVVAAVAPAVDGPPAIERAAGVLKIGSRLTARPGAWTGTAPIALEYQWLRCDVAGEACRPIEAATRTVLSLTATDFGEAGALAGTLRVTVTGRNRGGALTTRSEPVGQGPQPVATPTPRPTPVATPTPRPTPAATPRPTPAATPRPTPAPTPARKPPASAKKPPATTPTITTTDAAPLVVRSPTTRIDRRGRLSLRLTCPGGTIRCTGRWTASARGVSRAMPFSLQPGKARRWRVKLAPGERRKLRRAKKLTVVLAVTGQAPSTRKVTLRR